MIREEIRLERLFKQRFCDALRSSIKSQEDRGRRNVEFLQTQSLNTVGSFDGRVTSEQQQFNLDNDPEM